MVATARPFVLGRLAQHFAGWEIGWLAALDKARQTALARTHLGARADAFMVALGHHRSSLRLSDSPLGMIHLAESWQRDSELPSTLSGLTTSLVDRAWRYAAERELATYGEQMSGVAPTTNSYSRPPLARRWQVTGHSIEARFVADLERALRPLAASELESREPGAPTHGTAAVRAGGTHSSGLRHTCVCPPWPQRVLRSTGLGAGGRVGALRTALARSTHDDGRSHGARMTDERTQDRWVDYLLSVDSQDPSVPHVAVLQAIALADYEVPQDRALRVLKGLADLVESGSYSQRTLLAQNVVDLARSPSLKPAVRDVFGAGSQRMTPSQNQCLR